MSLLIRETVDIPKIRRPNDQYLVFPCHNPDVFSIRTRDAQLVWGITPNKKPHY